MGSHPPAPEPSGGIDFSFFPLFLFSNAARTERDDPSARWKLTKQFLAELARELNW